MNRSHAAEFRYDHGVIAWTQVFVAHLLVFNGFGYFSSFSLFESYWVDTLERSASDVAWVGSIQLFLLFFVGTISGRAMDAGYFKSLLYTGCSLQLLSIFTTSAVRSYWQLLLSQGVAQGLGNGLLFTPLVTLVSVYFKRYRAIALSISACGAPLGGVIFALIARQLVPSLGFPWAVRIMGFVVLFNTIVIVSLARPRQLSKSSGPLVEWNAFMEKTYALFVIGLFFVLWGIYVAYFYLTKYSQDILHKAPSNSLILLIILNASGVLGRLVPAFLADQFFGAFNVLLPFTFATGVMLLVWAAITNYSGYMVFAIMYGMFVNAVQTLFPSTLASLTTDVSKMGVRTGMGFTVGSFACLTGAPIAGALIDLQGGSYLYMQVFAGISVLVGCGLLVTARYIQHHSSCANVPKNVDCSDTESYSSDDRIHHPVSDDEEQKFG